MSRKKRKPYARQSRDDGRLIPNFIKEWRLYRGFETQKDLAIKCGLPSQTINRLEAHTLAWTLFSLERLADVLDCTPGDLISRHPGYDAAIFEIHKKLSRAGREELVNYGKRILETEKK